MLRDENQEKGPPPMSRKKKKKGNIQKKLKKAKKKKKSAIKTSNKTFPKQTAIKAENIAQILRNELLRPQYSHLADDVFSQYSQKFRELHISSNQQIIKILQDYGIDYNEGDFLKEVQQFPSSYSLLTHWKNKYSLLDIPGLDETVICEAANILAKRLIPDFVNNDVLDDMIQEGYRLLSSHKFVETCEIWHNVWEHLKKHFTSQMKSIDDVEKVFYGTQSISGWAEDFEMQLGNAGQKNPSFREKRIQYCREFYTRFPKSDDGLIQNMKRAEAESYFSLGMLDKGESAFQALVNQFPDCPWGYIGWADMYSGWFDNVPVNYQKSENLYNKALSVASNNYDKDTIQERLNDLEQQREKLQNKLEEQ